MPAASAMATAGVASTALEHETGTQRLTHVECVMEMGRAALIARAHRMELPSLTRAVSATATVEAVRQLGGSLV